MMESDLPCLGLPFAWGPSSSSSFSSSVDVSGNGEVSRERDDLCPFLRGGRTLGPVEEILDVGVGEGRGRGAFARCRSPRAYPFWCRDREGRPSLNCCRATFLNVMTHSRSSPAYTVPCVNWTETRMLLAEFLDIADSVAATHEVVGGDRCE